MTVTAGRIEEVGMAALIRHGASEANAASTARAVALAEAEGNAICGIYYLPIFCSHLSCGKIDGTAVPRVSGKAGAWTVDAGFGFAHPAIEAGSRALVTAAKETGVATLGVRNSYNCLALSHHVRPLAEQGLIGIVMSNAPAAVAPPGARAPLFGTNPIAYAIPHGETPIIADQSMSAVTKTAMLMRAETGEPIPEGWAQTVDGRPTTDPAEGLTGALLPSGGQKGANLGLLIELLAAALTGSKLSVEASSLGDDEGGPPAIGQFLIAIDPSHSGADFAGALTRMAAAFDDAGARLPGRSSRSLASEWRDVEVSVDAALWARCEALAV